MADPTGAAVLATTGGSLPTVRAEWTSPERMATASVRTLRAWCGDDVALLEVHGGDEVDDAPEIVPILTVVERLGDARSVPDGCVWRPLGDVAPSAAPPLQARLGEWLAEWRGDRRTEALRAPWSAPGWYRRACAWITDQLDERGRPPTGPIEQSTHWEISAVMRVDTARGPVWFKSVFRVFHHEPAVSELLDHDLPGRVPTVLAVDRHEGWLLLDDLGADVVADHPEADDDTIRRLVECQRAFIARGDDLRRVGCPVRPFGDLAPSLAAVLGDPALREWVGVTAARARAMVAWIEVSAAAVERLGFPDTLVHGDFHPENAMVTGDGPVILDWSDAAVANPLVDAMTWSSWLDDEPDRGRRAWRRFFEEWADVCPLERAEAQRPVLEGLAAGYHAVSYAGIVRNLEPLQRPALAGGLRQYVEALDRVVPT